MRDPVTTTVSTVLSESAVVACAKTGVLPIAPASNAPANIVETVK